jgi:hypothetical protein
MEELEKEKIRAFNYWRDLPMDSKYKRTDEAVDIKHFLIVLFYYKFNMSYFEIQDFFRLKNHSTCNNALTRVFTLWKTADRKFLENTVEIRKMFPISLDREVLNEFKGLTKRTIFFVSPEMMVKLKGIQLNHDFVSLQTTIAYIINNFQDAGK